MVRQKKGCLCVESSGKRNYICVPSNRAQDLHQYLRTNRVHSSPPEPSFSGHDCIELSAQVDVDTVQLLLNVWK